MAPAPVETGAQAEACPPSGSRGRRRNCANVRESLHVSSATCLILGCGNAERGDDAAGLLAARQLRAFGFDAREHSGDGAALMELWAGAARVILIDAVVTGAPAGTVSRWDARAAPLARETLRSSTHAFGVAEAIQLARVLDRLPPSLEIWGIEGAQFTAGAAPSAEVLAGVERATREIAATLKE